MAPPMRTHESGWQAEPIVSSPYMAFSMSLTMAYHHATLDHAQKPAHPRPHRKRPAGPRAPPSTTKTVAPSIQEPNRPAAACDTTLNSLSPEAQQIQDQARASYNTRKSSISDRESLRSLEVLPSHIHWDSPAPTSRPSCRPRLLPKYFPPTPPKLRSPRFTFDSNAPPTTQPTQSSGNPLRSIQNFGKSFSDDSDIFQDDDYFLERRKRVGDRLPAGGISLYARLEDIRMREAGGSSYKSSASESLPRVLSTPSMRSTADEAGEPHELERVNSKGEEIEGWLHVESSAVLRREIADEEWQAASQELARRGMVKRDSIGGSVFDGDKGEEEQKVENDEEGDDCDADQAIAMSESSPKHAAPEEGMLDLIALEKALEEIVPEPLIEEQPTDDEAASDHDLDHCRDFSESQVVGASDEEGWRIDEENDIVCINEELQVDADNWLEVESSGVIQNQMRSW